MADFGVKVTPVFELENSGFARFREELQKKLEEASKDAKLTIKKIAFEGDAKDVAGVVKGIQSAFEKIDFSKAFDFSGAMKGTEAGIKEVSGLLSEIRSVLEGVSASLGSLGTAGESGIRPVIESLEELNRLATELNNKNFNIQNVFQAGGEAEGANAIRVYGEEARALNEYLIQLRDNFVEVTNTSRGATGVLLTMSTEFAKLQSFEPDKIAKALSDPSMTTQGLVTMTGQLNEYRESLMKLVNTLRSKGIEVPMPDDSRMQAAVANVRAFDEQSQKMADTFAKEATAVQEVTNNIHEASVKAADLKLSGPEAAEDFERLNGVLAEISANLDGIQQKILSAFNVQGAIENLQSIKLDNISVELSEAGRASVGESISRALQDASDNIKLVISHVELSAEAQKEIANVTQHAASGADTKGGSAAIGRAKDTDSETEAIKRQTEAMWQNYEAWKRSEEEKARASGWDAYDALLKEEAAREKEREATVRAAEEYYDAEEKKAQAAEKSAQKIEAAEARKAEAAERSAQKTEEAAKKAAQASADRYSKQLDRLDIGQPGIKFSENESAMQDYRVAIDAARQAIDSLREASAQDRASAITDTQEKIAAVMQLRSQYNEVAKAEALAGKIDTFLSKNGRLSAETRSQLQGWSNDLKSGVAATEGRIDGIAHEFNSLSGAIKAAGSGGKTFFQTLKDGWSKFGGWSIVTKSFTKVISVFKQMVTAVKEVDSAMTELRKVTDLTASGYEKFYNNATKMAVNVGAKLSDTINATADFSRLGFNIDEASQLAEAALVYQNVGDGIESVSEATESLISTMKAFGIQAEESMSIVDMFNEVGNNFAISSTGIGEALQRSASALATAGNTIQESIGLVVAANDVVQNPESVGTALKTLTMYIRAAKTEAEEAGIATDGMANSVAQLQKEILALTGVDIMDGSNTFKSTYQILDEISKVWNDLTDVTQANVLNLLGGKRNANVLSSLLANFKDARAAMETAANSAGSAWAENEKYLNSIEGKTKQLQASFETMANEIINSDLVKTFIDLGKAIADAVTLLQRMGLLVPTIVGLTTTFKILSSTTTAISKANSVLEIIGGEGNTESKISRITAEISQLGTVAKQLAGTKILGGLADQTIDDDLASKVGDIAREMQNASMKTLTFDGVLTAVKTRLAGLGQGLKTFIGSSLGKWTLGITGAIALYNVAKNAYDNYINSLIEGAEKTWSEHQNIEKTASENKKALDEISDEFKTLREGVDRYGNNVSLTDEQYERYLSLCKEIISITPSLKNSYNEKGSSLKTGYITILDDAIKKQQEFLDNDTQMTVGNAPQVVAGWSAEISKYRDDVTSAMQGVVFDVLQLHTDGAKSASEVWGEALSKIGAEYLFGTEAGGADRVNLDAVYKIRANWEKVIQSFRDAGFADEEITKLQTMIGPLNDFFDVYEERLTGTVELFSLSASYLDQTKSLWNVIAQAGQTDVLKNGLFSVLSPTASYEENLAATTDYLNQMVFAIYEVNDLRKQLADNEDFDIETAWDDLYDRFGQYPAIIGMIRDALFGATQASQENAAAVENQTKSYEQLADSMENISKATSFLNSLRSDNKDTFSLIKSAQEFIDMYNGIFTGEGEQIDLSSMFSFDEDGMPSWDTHAVEIYTEAIVRAAFADTTFAQENPEVVDVLVAEATAFQNASKAAVTFADATSQANNIASIRQDIDEFLNGNGTDANKLNIISEIDTVIEKWNELGKARAEMTEGGEEWTDVTLQDFFGESLDDMDLAKEKLLEFGEYILDVFSNEDVADDSLIELLRNVMTAMGEAEEKAYSLSDAMSALSSVSKFLTDGFDTTNPLSTIDDALGVLESWNAALKAVGQDGSKSLADLIVIGDSGEVSEKAGALRQVYIDIANAAIDANDKLADVEKSALKAQVGGWVDQMLDAEAVKKKTEEIEEAFGKIRDIMGYMSDLSDYREGKIGYFDMLEHMYDIVEKYDDIKLEDLWDFDSSSFKDIGDIQLDKMIDKLATDLEINEDEVEDWKNHVKKSFKEAEEAANAYETATKSISLADSLNGFLADVRSGDKDPLSMLSSAVSLAEDLGLKLEEVVSAGAGGKMTFNTDALTTAFEKYIDDLVTAGSLNKDLAAQIKNAAKAEGELAEEAKTAAERMADALSNMQSLYSFMQSGTAGDSDILTVLKSAQEQFKTYQDMVEDGLETTPLDIFSFITVDSSGIKENVDTAKKLYADMADQMINEWIAETKKANAEKSWLTLLTGEEEWENGLTPEQAAWFNQIKTQILAHLNDLNAEVEPTIGDIINNLQSLFDFQNKINTGESVDFTSVYDDLENLKTILGDQTLNLGDLIKWEDGDFKYAFSQTDLLGSKIDEFAQKIVADMGLTGDAAKAAADKIKASFQGSFEFTQLNQMISDIQSASSFAETMDSFMRGETGLLDMFSAAASIAETLGLEMQEVWNFEEMRPEATAVYTTIDAMVDKMASANNYSDEFALHLKEAARFAQESQSHLASMESTNSGLGGLISSAGDFTGGAALTYETYKNLMAVSREYGAAIDYVNGRLTVNAQKFYEVTDAIAAEAIQTAQLQVAQNKLKMNELIAKYDQLTDAHEKVTTGQQIIQLQNESAALAILANELSNATNAFTRFNNAAHSSEGDMFASAKEAYQIIYDTLYNPDSEFYRMIGDEKFQLALELDITPNVDIDDPEFQRSFEQIERYFSDENGLQNFIDDLTSEGLINSAGQFDTTLSEIASTLNISEAAARGLIQQLNKFNDPKNKIQIAEQGAVEEQSQSIQEKIAAIRKETEDTLAKIDELNAKPVDPQTENAQTDAQSLSQTFNDVKDSVTKINEVHIKNLTSEANAAAVTFSSTLSTIYKTLQNIAKISKINITFGMSGSGGGNGGSNQSWLEKTWGSIKRFFGFSNAKGTDGLGFRGGKSLVGELGREIVVDVDGGRWYTVGNRGPEIVDIPKNSIVFDHEKTEAILSKRAKKAGAANAAGTGGTAMAGGFLDWLQDAITTAWQNVTDGKVTGSADGKVTGSAPQLGDQGNNKNKGSGGGGTSDVQDLTAALEELTAAFEEVNNEFDQYIAHFDYDYFRAERANDYDTMLSALQGQADYYRQVYEAAAKAVEEMRAAGADESNEELRSMESNMWDAYENLYGKIDEIRELFTTALTEDIDNLQNAFSNLDTMVEEYNTTGHISTDTFQAIAENGLQYLSLLQDENGEYTISADKCAEILALRREQLAVETAMSYVDQLSEALRNNEVGTVEQLLDLQNKIGDSTWDTVYANLELLKTQGLTEEEYQKALDTINTWRNVSNDVLDVDVSDVAQEIKKITSRIEQLHDAIDDMQSAVGVFETMLDEIGENGYITVDTFQSLLENGIQYLSVLEFENGQYSLNREAIEAIVAAKTEELAIESALEYVNQIKQAAQNGEIDRVNTLCGLTAQLAQNTWDAVYAQLALLQTSEDITEEQYEAARANVEKLQNITPMVNAGSVFRAPSVDDSSSSGGSDEVRTLADDFEDLNEQIEHFIAHQEFMYDQSERARHWDGMAQALINEVGYYKRIMQEAQETLRQLEAQGYDDFDEEIQRVEEGYWEAYRNMYEALDKIRALRVDALRESIDGITSAYDKFKTASEQYNSSGFMTVEVFSDILEGGLQYLAFIKEENGQYVINADSIKQYTEARKEELAIETALQYIGNLREALQNREIGRLDNLIDATEHISHNSWDQVYATAALLKAEGMTAEQYDKVIQNIDRLRGISASVTGDLTAAEDEISAGLDDQKDALDKLLGYVESLIKAETQDRIKAIKDEIAAYKEMIDLKKEALDTTKKENEYEREVADKVQEIAKIQAKLDLMSLDDSRKAVAERAKLAEDLASKQQELSEYQANHSYDLQKEALDQEASAYEESRQTEIDALNDSISSTEKVYQLAIERIRTQWDTLYADLIAWNTEQGSVINDEITAAWEAACNAVKKYGGYVEAVAATTGTGATGDGSHYVIADIPKYHNGGIVDSAGELNDKEVMAVLQKGELVLNDEKKKGLFRVIDFVKELEERLHTSIGNLKNLMPTAAMVPAMAGLHDISGYREGAGSAAITISNNFAVTVQSDNLNPGDARKFGAEMADSITEHLYDAFTKRGITSLSLLRHT